MPWCGFALGGPTDWRKQELELWFGSFSCEENYTSENQKDSTSFLLDLNEFSFFL